MGNLDLAAASLGAAAPVPPAQDSQSPCAAGFADVLAGCTHDAPDDAGADAQHARNSKGQPGWVALEQLARQLALSSGHPASALSDPKAARVTTSAATAPAPVDAPDEDAAAATALAHGAAGPLGTLPPPAPALNLDSDPLVAAATAGGGLEDAAAGVQQLDTGADQGGAHVAAAVSRVEDALMAKASTDGVQKPTAAADGDALPLVQAEGAPTPPETAARAHRPDVEAFREWAASVARAHATTASPVAATLQSVAIHGQEPAVNAAAGHGVTAVSLAPAQPIDEGEPTTDRAARGLRRTPEAAKTIVERFKANEMPIEAVPESGRVGSRTTEQGPAAPAARSHAGTAPPPRFDMPVVQAGATTATRAAAAAAEAPALLDADGALETQIVQALKVQWGHDGGEARIRLQPHYLGELTIQLRVEHGAVTAHLVASAADVRQWIESNEAVLRQSLAQHDLELERLVVVEEEPASGTRDQRPADQEPRGQARRQNRRSGRDATFEVVV